MTEKIRKQLMTIASQLNKDYKFAIYHGYYLNNNYFLDKIQKVCNVSSTAKHKLEVILFSNNIMLKNKLVKDIQIVTAGKLLDGTNTSMIVQAETIKPHLKLYPKYKASVYVKPRDNHTYNLSAKDVGTVLHQLL